MKNNVYVSCMHLSLFELQEAYFCTANSTFPTYSSFDDQTLNVSYVSSSQWRGLWHIEIAHRYHWLKKITFPYPIPNMISFQARLSSWSIYHYSVPNPGIKLTSVTCFSHIQSSMKNIVGWFNTLHVTELEMIWLRALDRAAITEIGWLLNLSTKIDYFWPKH